VTTEAQFKQMGGRGCRTRGICDAIMFANTGEDAKTLLERIQVTSYKVTLDYIKFLNFLKKLQMAPVKEVQPVFGKKGVTKSIVEPEVVTLYKKWTQTIWLRSVKELEQAAEIKN
jgi:hypothetical protein